MAGKVWLIGAGPGDVGLFTIKGAQVLKEAEVIVYDSLVGQGVLAMIPGQARSIYVGKRAGNHSMPQEQINRLLLEEAMKGYRVVRLKGGDPFLFGRGGEELELLQEHGIPYEVVPGVTSPLAVPAYNGIPVTHRDYCSSLHIVTGHQKEGGTYDIDFDALIRAGGTLIFLMGSSSLGHICSKLMEAGMAADMPAAILQEGTTARQKRIVATVATLTNEAKQQGIGAPAIIVAGKVCELADQLNWYEKLPLAGYKVLVTRPRDLISALALKLRIQGAEVLELPAIKTTALKNQDALHKAFLKINSYQWIVFTSPTGVNIFWEEMKAKGLDVRTLGTAKIAVIGSGTRKALEEKGIFVDLIAPTYDGAALGKALADICGGGERILIPRGKTGSHEIIEELMKQKHLVIEDIPTYETLYESQEIIDEALEFEAGNIDCAVFTSASTVKGFAAATAGLDYSKVRAACIGKQTKMAADAYGMKTHMAEEATIDSLIALVCNLKKEQHGNVKKTKKA